MIYGEIYIYICIYTYGDTVNQPVYSCASDFSLTYQGITLIQGRPKSQAARCFIRFSSGRYTGITAISRLHPCIQKIIKHMWSVNPCESWCILIHPEKWYLLHLIEVLAATVALGHLFTVNDSTMGAAVKKHPGWNGPKSLPWLTLNHFTFQKPEIPF